MLSIPVERVLVPVDFSDFSMAALDTARGLVKGPEGLHVVSVLPPMLPPTPAIAWGTVDDPGRMDAVKKELALALEARGLQHASAHIRVGTPGTEVAAIADVLDVQLVVLSSHGRTGLRRVALGSVAERIVRLCKAPVLVLKTDT